MTKKSKTLIIILGSLILISGAYYGSTVWVKKKNDSASQSYTPSPRLGNLESSELVKMEFPDFTVEKEAERWKLVSLNGKTPPGGTELDQETINRLTWNLASMWIDSVVDEEPADLSVYGLDHPSARAAVTDFAGTTAAYLLGDTTPSQTSFYIMEEGDPKVYSISAYLAVNMKTSVDMIRQKSLFQAFQYPELRRFSMESPGAVIKIEEKPASLRPYLASAHTSYILTSHYKLPRGVSSEPLSKLLAPFSSLAIEDFIDDTPLSLGLYGLDKPAKISLRTRANSLDLLIGNRIEGKRYAKLAGAPGVFTLSGLESVIGAKAFDLTDKFILLINIDTVDRIEITGGEKNLAADLRRNGDGESYFINGKKTEDKAFRNFYESVIGLLADAEYPAASAPPQAGAGSITIEHTLNTPPGEKASITLIPYNRDFYAIRQEGTTEFLISRNQISRIFTRADEMVYED